MQTKRENRGGARPNTGRKPEAASYQQVKKMQEKAVEWEKKYGYSVEDVLLGVIYGEEKFGEITVASKLSAIKLWAEKTWIQVNEGSEADKLLGQPAVYLPSERPDPAAVIPFKTVN